MLKKTEKEIQSEMVMAAIIVERDEMILAMNNDLQMLMAKNKQLAAENEELKKQLSKKEE